MWNFAYKFESHLFAWPRVVRGVLSYRRHLQPLVSYTKAVALDGAESDPSSVLCYRVATFGGENTGNNVMGQRFIACPLYLQRSHGGQKLSARISKTNYGGRSKLVSHTSCSRLVTVILQNRIFLTL